MKFCHQQMNRRKKYSTKKESFSYRHVFHHSTFQKKMFQLSTLLRRLSNNWDSKIDKTGWGSDKHRLGWYKKIQKII